MRHRERHQPHSSTQHRRSKVAPQRSNSTSLTALLGADPSTITRPLACRCIGNMIARTAQTQHSTLSVMSCAVRRD